MTTVAAADLALRDHEAVTYASWFASLGEPTRLRLLHAVATAGPEGTTVGALTESLGISQSTCSHHVRKLADTGFVHLERQGTTTRVSINQSCCTGLPHAADAVMGLVATPSDRRRDLPVGVEVRPMRGKDWEAVRRIYAEGIATGLATFETAVPSRSTLDARWLPDQRWVAQRGGEVLGWAAATPVSARRCYAGVVETSLYVGAEHRGRGVGRALIHRQVTEADRAGLWTLQTSIFPENRASIALHHAAGFRTVGVRERIAELNEVWRDTVLLERRAATDQQDCS